MSKIIKVMVLVILAFIFVTGLWAVDIGASGSNMQSAGYELQVVGLWFARTSTQQYHLGLLLSSMSFLMLCAMFIFEMFNNKNKIENKEITDEQIYEIAKKVMK